MKKRIKHNCCYLFTVKASVPFNDLSTGGTENVFKYSFMAFIYLFYCMS